MRPAGASGARGDGLGPGRADCARVSDATAGGGGVETNRFDPEA